MEQFSQLSFSDAIRLFLLLDRYLSYDQLSVSEEATLARWCADRTYDCVRAVRDALEQCIADKLIGYAVIVDDGVWTLESGGLVCRFIISSKTHLAGDDEYDIVAVSS